MGMGLILGGIGKGIADAGAAYAGGMSKMAEFEMQQEREAQREQRQLRLADQLETQKEERRAAQAIEVEKRASEAPLKRDVSVLQGVAAKVEGDSPVMGKEEMLKLIKDNPEYREVYRKAGLIGEDKMDPRLRQASDQEAAAREVGVSSTLLESYRKAKTDTLTLIKEENKEVERKSDKEQMDRRLDIMEKGADARAKSSAGGGTLRVSKTITDNQGGVIAVMSDGTTRDTGVKSGDFEKRVTAQINLMSKNDYAFNQLSVEEKRAKAMEVVVSQPTKPSDNAAPAAPTIPDLPKGAVQIGTSGGKPVYQTPDGKKFIGK
jgi:hypothetical protein